MLSGERAQMPRQQGEPRSGKLVASTDDKLIDPRRRVGEVPSIIRSPGVRDLLARGMCPTGPVLAPPDDPPPLIGMAHARHDGAFDLTHHGGAWRRAGRRERLLTR